MGSSFLQSKNTAVESKQSAKAAPQEQQKEQHQEQPQCPRTELKNKLKSLLAKYDGSTKQPEVMQVIDELAALNTETCWGESAQFLGEWFTLTSPNFPGRQKTTRGDEDVVQYKLGRLSFNIFQPNNLICTLRSVRNPVYKQGEKDGVVSYSYPLILDITIHTPDGDLPAVLVNEAYCHEHPTVSNRIMVTFTGGTLMPAEEMKGDTKKLKLWAQTFEGAYTKAENERSYLGRLFHFVLKMVLGLTMPSDETLLKNTFHFDMKRCAAGHLDILYLDEDFRITKGNRGTIVVVERSKAVAQQ